MTELEELKKRVAELEKAAKPPEPFVPGPRFQFDPTDGMSMPASALKAMIDAVPNSLMSDLRADSRKPNPVTQGATPQSQPIQRGSGWVDERPLEPPPGVELCDRLMDAQDAQDRTELARKIAQARLSKGETA